VKYIFLLAAIVLISCNEKNESNEVVNNDGPIELNEYLTETAPDSIPLPYKTGLISGGMLVHRGIFSPDLNEYYFTISDKQFQHFNVKVVHKENSKWSIPKDAFFNTNFNEHGVSFSPDGKYIYYSSTRPVNIQGVQETWHLWRLEKINAQWMEPKFVDIPNLRDKLVSHPSITNDGTIYFHAGSTDYSQLHIYYSKEDNGKFTDAIKLPSEINFRNKQNCPYIAPDESYLLFESTPNLYLCYYDNAGNWSAAKKLNERINTRGKGNPYITPDQKYLFYAAGLMPNPNDTWAVYWVSTENVFTDFQNANR